MSVHVWESADAPAGHRFLARVMIGGKFTPMVANGSDRDELVSRVEAFLESEKVRFSTQVAGKKTKKQDPSPTEPPRPAPTIDLDNLL